MSLDIHLILPIAISLLSLGFVWWLYLSLKKADTGTAKMQAISDAIKEGANAYLKRQNKTIVLISLVLAAVLAIFGMGGEAAGAAGWQIAAAFLFGALCSVVAGYVGMWISVRANIRSAAGAQKGLSRAFDAAMKGGAISGIIITAMSLLGISIMVSIYMAFGKVEIGHIPNLIAGFGFGASLVALFAQLGGGIYTKAADVGADLVGKIEQNIPEDDPRNPAVIADLVGDNVGDCAGRGADLFESTAAENISAMILGAALVASRPDLFVGKEALAIGVIFFPLVARALGLVCSIIGIALTKVDNEGDAMKALNMGFIISTVLSAIVFYFAISYTFSAILPTTWMYLLAAGYVGLIASWAFVLVTQYFTSSDYQPIKDIVKASRTGGATNIIAGLSVGYESTASTVMIIAISLLSAFWLGEKAMIGGGIFGTAIATMGMLSTAAYILAMDTFGPITDNAGGIVEMSDLPEEVRKSTDKLDAVGNTTKAITKGYAMGSAALASFLLFSAFLKDAGLETVGLQKPTVFIGAFLGAMLVFLFSAFALKAVGNAAGSIVEEVRRQFKEKPGIMSGTEKPDYAKCVDITTAAALKEMVMPGLLAVLLPIFVGVVMGREEVAGFIMVGTIVGVLLATVMNNAGGAWDNAKKFIEAGHEGGKGSKTHGAAVTGDTVGDPFKDTAGPSLHVLVKLLGTLSLAMVALFK
ncbi:MAG: sodium-translocating pyrophosphatase [Candidatus Paceibacterota bacterium]